MKTIAILALFLGGCVASPAPSCMPACADGFACVDGSCVGAQSMPDAGTLGTSKCDPACGGLTPHCNDSGHCVTCLADTDCPLGDHCRVVTAAISACVPGCTDDSRCAKGESCCDGACVDTQTDSAHCGGCGKSCPSLNADAICTAGTCGAGACHPGYGDCNGDKSDGCEANLHVDGANCTACGDACSLPNAIAACADGCYLSACNFGYDDCNNDQGDGCETNVVADRLNCGGCGMACTNPPNGTAQCTAGNCILGTCNQGFVDCDGVAKNGCEANLAFDGNNCGACGNVCPMQAPACMNGVCSAGLAGLVSYWKFDGTPVDVINHNDLTASQGGQLPGFQAGKVGQATSSPMGDPQNMWIDPIPNNIDVSNDFTFAFWARNNASSWYDNYAAFDSGGVTLYRHEGSNWRFVVYLDDGMGHTQTLDSGVNLPAPPDNTWFFVAFWHTGNTFSIAINDAAPVTATVGPLKRGPALYVSRMASGYSWAGQMDEMGYWNRALTQGELDVVYNGGNGRTFP